MHRSILIPLATGAILIVFAALPPMLPDSMTMSLSGSALAQKTPKPHATNLNSSRSNAYRQGRMTGPGAKASRRARSNAYRQGRMTGPGAKARRPACLPCMDRSGRCYPHCKIRR